MGKVYSQLMLPPLTVFDVETTGLDPKKGHRVVELAAVRIENGKIMEDRIFSTLVNPERDIPLETTRIHNISNGDIKAAPTIMTVLPDFLEFARGSTLIAHNATFDLGFLEMEKEFCWGYVELPDILCTMRLSQSLFPQFGLRHNLDVLSERFQIALPADRHRALPDVIQTAKVLLKMLEYGKIQSMDELRRRAGLGVVVGK